MTSPLLALFTRSLREESQLKRTYLVPAAMALVLGFLLHLVLRIAFLLSEIPGTLSWAITPGRLLFAVFAGFNFVVAIFVGLACAGVFGVEKEGKMLGLLRITPLGPASILLWKLGTVLVRHGLVLCIQIPFFLVAISMGDIFPGEILTVLVALGAFTFFSANLGMLASVVCRKTENAAGLAILSLCLFFGSGRIAHEVGRMPIHFDWLPEKNAFTQACDALCRVATAASPFTPLWQIFVAGGPSSRTGPDSFQALSSIGLGLVCFLIAWLSFERCCGEHSEITPARGLFNRSRERTRLFTPSRAWNCAIAWKEFYFTMGGKWWIPLKVLFYLAPVAVAGGVKWSTAGIIPGPRDWERCGMLTLGIALFAGLVELAFAANTIFRGEVQSQTWSSLAMLPHGPRWVGYEKLLGVIPALTAAGICFTTGLLLAARPVWDWVTTSPDWAIVGAIFFAGQCLFLLHLVTGCSLYVRLGSFILALATYLLLVLVAAILLEGHPLGTPLFLALSLLTLVVTVALHWQIGRRLVALAGKDH